jgi:hypothetical protein
MVRLRRSDAAQPPIRGFHIYSGTDILDAMPLGHFEICCDLFRPVCRDMPSHRMSSSLDRFWYPLLSRARGV